MPNPAIAAKKDMAMNWFIAGLSLLFTMTFVVPAHAWKIETHLWQANEILNEISTDGSVRLPLGSYRIDQDLLRALSAPNRPAFLIGVLGPDTYPDMIAGQMTTHPGLEVIKKDYYNKKDDLRGFQLGVPSLLSQLQRDLNAEAESFIAQAQSRPMPHHCLERLRKRSPGINSEETPEAARGRLWQTDDWLCWVRAQARAMSPDGLETAFAAGYFMHAAMDMWAHSYVNHYSGDIWVLSEEQEVEARHMALESVVARMHDPATKFLLQYRTAEQSKGQTQQFGNLLKEQRDALTPLKAPVEFVRSTLILNPAVANQYARETFTLHLFAMYLYWSEVQRLGARLDPIRAGIVSTANTLGQKLSQLQSTYATAQALYNTAVQSVDGAYQAFTAAEVAARSAQDHFTQVKNTVLQKISGLTDTLIATLPPDLQNQYRTAQSALEQANRTLDDRRRDYDRLAKDRDEKQQVMKQRLEEVNLYQSTLTTVARVRDQSLMAVSAGTAQWQQGIERAVDAYIRAWEETSKELMRPPGSRFSRGHDVTEPLKQWVLCWGPTFGLPVLTTIAPVCDQARSGYMAVNNNLTDLKLLIQNSTIPMDVRQAIEQLDKVVTRTSGLVLVETAKLVSNTIRLDDGALAGHAHSFVNLRLKTPGPEDVAAEFSDNTATVSFDYHQNYLRPKSLVTFPRFPTNNNILELFARDFGIPKERLFALLSHKSGVLQPNMAQASKPFSDTVQTLAVPEPTRYTLGDLPAFAALQNSVVMAKLVLLDGAQLNAMVRTQVPPKANYPYHEQAPAGEVLIGAIRSIDGDHQWQKFAPQFPRSPVISCQRILSEEARTFCSKSRQFGYDAVDAERGGLKLWQDSSIRAEVFNRLFKGPLAPGLISHLGPANLAVGIGICPANPFPATDSLPQTDPCRGMDQNNRLALPTMQTVAPAPAPTAPPQQAPGQFIPKAGLPPPTGAAAGTQAPPPPPKGQTLPPSTMPGRTDSPAPPGPMQQAPGQFIPKAGLPPPSQTSPPVQNQGSSSPPKGQTLPSSTAPRQLSP